MPSQRYIFIIYRKSLLLVLFTNQVEQANDGSYTHHSDYCNDNEADILHKMAFIKARQGGSGLVPNLSRRALYKVNDGIDNARRYDIETRNLND